MKRVIMIGPSPSAKGGIATVIGTLLRVGYERDGHCRFIQTHISAGLVRKAWVALWALLRVTCLMATGQVALLHAHVASEASFWRKAIFIRVAQFFGCPVIFHLHSGEFRVFLEQRMSPGQRKFAVALMRRVDYALVLSDDAAQLLSGIGVRNIELLPNPIEINRVSPARQTSSEILFLGRLDNKKGVYDLLRAFKYVRDQVPEARLILGGEGEVAQVRELATALGILNAVELPGWVNEAQRSVLLARAAVFVLPSHFEQMPMTVLEAMVAGVPVVATRVGGVPCMLENGACGKLVDVADLDALASAITGLLVDRPAAQAMAERAHQRVLKEYEAGVVLSRLQERYAALAQ
ncbi:glycosyltransferase family 4 protein [Duganella qianjiadongensis]|uniref:Glycosyltransferase n=1 Tax=Duganella qianjiadongensis TaxID=2692176 RepID=A0ABW9VQ13_9BURK|nr:glycosyltransferase family 4 protein [Duganella qianjiadongensis]MYM41659.1 glycosyltransferase [Duganella qianjiadongensis]